LINIKYLSLINPLFPLNELFVRQNANVTAQSTQMSNHLSQSVKHNSNKKCTN